MKLFKFIKIIIIPLALNIGCDNQKSPDPNIVAIFAKGQITRKEVEEHLNNMEEGRDSSTTIRTHQKAVYKDVVKKLVLDWMISEKANDKKLEISEEEIRNYYEDHKEDLITPLRMKIRYIRIGAGRTKNERERAEQRIQEAFQKLKPWIWEKEMSFEKVARDYSEDPVTVNKEDEKEEWISEDSNIFKGINDPLFHDIWGIPEGEIGHPFEFKGSHYILKVQKRKESQLLSFEEAQDRILNILTRQKQEELILKTRESLLNQANLVIYDEVIESMLAAK